MYRIGVHSAVQKALRTIPAEEFEKGRLVTAMSIEETSSLGMPWPATSETTRLEANALYFLSVLEKIANQGLCYYADTLFFSRS